MHKLYGAVVEYTLVKGKLVSLSSAPSVAKTTYESVSVAAAGLKIDGKVYLYADDVVVISSAATGDNGNAVSASAVKTLAWLKGFDEVDVKVVTDANLFLTTIIVTEATKYGVEVDTISKFAIADMGEDTTGNWFKLFAGNDTSVSAEKKFYYALDSVEENEMTAGAVFVDVNLDTTVVTLYGTQAKDNKLASEYKKLATQGGVATKYAFTTNGEYTSIVDEHDAYVATADNDIEIWLLGKANYYSVFKGTLKDAYESLVGGRVELYDLNGDSFIDFAIVNVDVDVDAK